MLPFLYEVNFYTASEVLMMILILVVDECVQFLEERVCSYLYASVFSLK